jgi:hypothetical protein
MNLIPGTDIGVFTLAPRLSIGPQRGDVHFPMFSRILINVLVVPGIQRDLFTFGKIGAIPFISPAIHQGLKTILGGGIFTHIKAV